MLQHVVAPPVLVLDGVQGRQLVAELLGHNTVRLLGRQLVDAPHRTRPCAGVYPPSRPNNRRALPPKIFSSSSAGKFRLRRLSTISCGSTHGWSLAYSSRSGPTKS